MKNNSSYKIQELASNIEKEIDRLKGQVEVFWDKEFLKYKQFGLCDTMSIVEFGSGPGFTTEKILKSFAQIKVTSIEIDEYLVELAKKNLEKQTNKNYEILQGSILDSKLANDTFDFAIVRLLLEHLADPLAAVEEVYRILKPNGIAVFIDIDLESNLTTHPHIPELKELFNAYCKKRSDEGGHPLIGRFLPVLLEKASFKKIDFDIICAHSKVVGNEVFMQSEGLGIPVKLVEEGYLNGDTQLIISDKWEKMKEADDSFMVKQLCICVGKK